MPNEPTPLIPGVPEQPAADDVELIDRAEAAVELAIAKLDEVGDMPARFQRLHNALGRLTERLEQRLNA